MPGPSDTPSALVGGASLYIVAEQGDAEAAAAWDYIKFLTSAQAQSQWAAQTGYVPVRQDATELDPYRQIVSDDPRFGVAFDQLLVGDNDLTAVGPALGPLREVRAVTAQAVADIYNGTDVAAELDGAAQQADLLITDYNSRNS